VTVHPIRSAAHALREHRADVFRLFKDAFLKDAFLGNDKQHTTKKSVLPN